MLQRILMAFVVGLVLVTMSTGSAVGASKCSGNKLKAAGKKATAKLNCLSKGVSKALAPDSTCLAKAEVKFSSTVAKAEAKAYQPPDTGCLTTGDATTIEGKVDTLVDDIDGLVADAPPAPANACDAAKVKAAGKKAKSKLDCHAKAVTKGLGVDSTCLAKAEVKFSSAAAKAETKVPPSCTATGDAGTYESTIDSAIDDIRSELVSTTTTSTTTTTTTSSTTTTTAPCCGGSPAACGTFMDAMGCGGHSGCMWNGMACMGMAVSCGAFATPLACSGQVGCMWAC